ncbi:DUF3472 domain-containing protein [Luteimonas panaciterrae]|uniref:DUF3472 domain-containing protein n=1 Tax=Luteimonas panaciterrae TaxID=363885 RepID=UPI001CFB5D02|nr:DUF5077 domain-containing protein [Luteimonas panaciterrae]
MRSLVRASLVLLWFVLPGIAAAQETTVTVPLGGNAFITKPAPAAHEVITETGLHNWDSNRAVASVYFSVQQAGELQVALVGALAGANRSTVKVTVGNQSLPVNLFGTESAVFPVGSFTIDRPGYVKLDLQGVSTDGRYYGDVSDVRIAGSAAVGAVFANDPENFYWSRRGPSVHLGYQAPTDTEYVYSEVTVPVGQDAVGSYYMANGFDGGYFGIQVNSLTERRVLFSIWDAPDGGKTTLVAKGRNVVTNDFGGEGTGGQSYLVYPWQAGHTYRFLTRARPDGNGGTLFTSWFAEAASSASKSKCTDWQLIATWKRPGGPTSLRSLYSFLESFLPENGYLGRSARYGNQWAKPAGGAWTELATARFTVDATGSNQQRLDYAGGVNGNLFYLHMGGFFSPPVAPGQSFVRTTNGTPPAIDLNTLP